MFDMRKIQEQVIFNVVKNKSSEEIANDIVFGENNAFCREDNPAWVKNTMKRIEQKFDSETIKQIRMDCQCGYACVGYF